MAVLSNSQKLLIKSRSVADPENYQALRQVTDCAVLARVYAHRGVQPEHLDLSLAQLLPPSSLMGIDAAVALLLNALQAQHKVLIVGDYDADGATSTALAMLALPQLGLPQIDYIVPNRFEFGYGLTPEIVELAAKHQPDLIITVDNGITSVEGVDAAQKLGIKVLVTDHHLPGETLPKADAIVNPNQPGDDFGSKNLAGVGVMFYLLMAFRATLRSRGWFAEQGIKEPNLAEFLDLVALGSVADVVPLDHNNRILVAQGLKRINSGRCRVGILALLQVAKRSVGQVVAADLGFAVGPRINAAGRLDDMSLGIECLLASHRDQAEKLAQQLNELNVERREIESSMKEEAMAHMAVLQKNKADMPLGICLYDSSWHQGVIGILAARVRERYYRPVIVFAEQDDDTLKGSARSIAGFHIRDGLEEVSAKYPELLQKFGGHAMAAGLSLAKKDYRAFAEAFDAVVQRHAEQHGLQNELEIDGELKADQLTMDLADRLRQSGPWGSGFLEPVFQGRFELLSHRIVGKTHLKMTCRVPGSHDAIDAIAFNACPSGAIEMGRNVALVYRLDVNQFRGASSLQLMVESFEVLR